VNSVRLHEPHTQTQAQRTVARAPMLTDEKRNLRRCIEELL